MKKLLKKIFRKSNMMRIYATRLENEVHELRSEINLLKFELRNTEILLEQANKDKLEYWENLTKAKKEKLGKRVND